MSLDQLSLFGFDPEPESKAKTKRISKFDLVKGEKLKKHGIEVAQITRGHLVEVARDYAKMIAHNRSDRTVIVDDVYAALLENEHDPTLLGNAWGSIFRESCWVFTGRWKKSERASNHARVVRVWMLK